MKYCFQSTQQYVIDNNILMSTFIELEIIISREGNKKSISFKETPKVIDGDNLEKELCKKEKRNKKRTVDCIFFTASPKRAIFVEFKFNLKNPTNLGKDEFDQKVSPTIAILPNISQTGIVKYVVVPEGLKNQVIRRIAGLFNNKPPISVLEISELKNKYF